MTEKRKSTAKRARKPRAKPAESAPPMQRETPPQLIVNQWRPGQSGNPIGRPRGSRNKLSEEFVQALYANFTEAVEEGGASKGALTIETVRTEDPVAYVKAIVALAPKHVHVKEDVLDAFDDDELTAALAAIAALRATRSPGEDNRRQDRAAQSAKPH